MQFTETVTHKMSNKEEAFFFLLPPPEEIYEEMLLEYDAELLFLYAVF